MKSIAILLLTSLISSAYAIDELDLFGETFSPSYDIKIKELNYEKNDEPAQASGSFSFDKFKVITNDTSIDLNNSTGFYDADIYVSNNLIGFKGEAARFVYRLAEEDFKYVNSFKWMKMSDLHFFMDRDRIALNGYRFAMQEPRTYLVAQSFDLNCGRHPDFLVNNGDGFLAGCLNFSKARSLQGEGFGIDYRLKDEDQNSAVELQGYFTDFEATQDLFSASALSLSAKFAKDAEVSFGDLELECGKIQDLVKISEESLIIPCASKFDVKSSQLDVKLLEENDKITLSSPSIVNNTDTIVTTSSRLVYSGGETNFSLRNSKINCSQPVGDKLDVGSYFQGCLDGLDLTPRSVEKSSDFSFVMDDRTVGDELHLTIDGDIKQIKASERRLHIQSKKTSLSVDRYLSLTFGNIDWRCIKRAGLRTFDIIEMLKVCKSESSMQMDSMQIIDHESNSEPIVAKILPKTIRTEKNKIHAEIGSVFVTDIEDFTVINNLVVDCDIEENGDVFKPDDLIAGCVKNGEATIPSIYSQDSKLNAQQLLNKSFKVENIRITKKHAAMSDISVKVVDRVINVNLKVRALGGNKKVSFSGPITWNKDQNLIQIRVTKSKLPLGIKSKTIFMTILKKFLVSERVTFPSKNIINVQL